MKSIMLRIVGAGCLALAIIFGNALPAMAQEYPCLGLINKPTEEEKAESDRKHEEMMAKVTAAWVAADGDLVKFDKEFKKLGLSKAQLVADNEKNNRALAQVGWGLEEFLLEGNNPLLVGKTVEYTDRAEGSLVHYWEKITPEQIQTCLNDGTNINLDVQSERRRTPLHNAARFNKNPEVIMTLLGAGADATIKDNNGHTPFDWIEYNEALKSTEAYQALKDAQY